MSVARKLERRLERLLDSVAGRMFSGRLHPSEIAGRLAREADFARFDHETGPATANRYVIMINPKDLDVDPDELASTLVAELDAHATEEGLRLEGPLTVLVQASEDVVAGDIICHVEVEPGDQVPWAALISDESTFEIGRNRALVGRSTICDTIVPHEDISRRHALVWRESDRAWIADLGSANGTMVDYRPVGTEPVRLRSGSVVSLADHHYRFRVGP